MRELKDILRELRAEHEMTQDDLARVDVYNDKAIIYYNITEKGQKNKAASGVRIRPVTWSSRNGIRTTGLPFVYGKYYILIVPFSHAA